MAKPSGQSAFSGEVSSPNARMVKMLSAATVTQMTVKSSQSRCQSFNAMRLSHFAARLIEQLRQIALARQIIQAHGGRIAAASAGLGQGSVFTVKLPLA